MPETQKRATDVLQDSWTYRAPGATTLLAAGLVSGIYLVLWYLGEAAKPHWDAALSDLILLVGSLLALTVVSVGALLIRKELMETYRPIGQPASKKRVALPYVTACTLTGGLAGLSFVFPDFNVAPLWTLNAPPLLLAQFLPIRPSSGNLVSNGLVVGWYIAYYFALTYPTFQLRYFQNNDKKKLRLRIAQFVLALIHLLLTALFLKLMQA